MEALLVCGIGFAAGWLARCTTSSLREQLVKMLVTGHHAADALRVRLAIEGEFFQDLMAEARARYESSRTGAPTQEPPKSGTQAREDSKRAAA